MSAYVSRTCACAWTEKSCVVRILESSWLVVMNCPLQIRIWYSFKRYSHIGRGVTRSTWKCSAAWGCELVANYYYRLLYLLWCAKLLFHSGLTDRCFGSFLLQLLVYSKCYFQTSYWYTSFASDWPFDWYVKSLLLIIANGAHHPLPKNLSFVWNMAAM